jgi:hypothetical protein
MRLTEYLSLVVIIGVFIWISVSGALELNQKYPDNPIDTANFSSSYDKIDTINTRVNATYNNFQKLGNEDVSWFQKIGAGIVAIPYAVINFPIIIAVAVGALMEMVTVSLGGIVPAIFITAITVFLLIEVVRRLLEFFQRARA